MPCSDGLIPMLAELPSLSEMLLVIGALLMALCLSVWLRQKAVARRPRLTPHEELERMRQDKGLEQDLTQLTAEIDRLTRKFTQELDQRTARLETLLAEADRKLAQLQPSPADHPAPAASASDGSVSPTSETRNPKSDVAAAPLPDDPLARSVYQLADQGLSAERIAQQLKEHVGKIELILALRSVG